MEEENKRLKEILRDKNMQIANFEKQVKEITRALNDWTNGYHDLERKIEYLENKEKEASDEFRQTIALRVAERDSFKEALRIVTRKVKINA